MATLGHRSQVKTTKSALSLSAAGRGIQLALK